MDQAEYRKLQKLIEPCLSPEDMDEFIIQNFGIELPWDTVDEESTSAPLKFLWEVYELMITGKGDNRHVLAAARNTAKTLTSSMLQFMSMLHFRRDGVHIAATLEQSAQAIRYLDNFMGNPMLVPYRKTDNVRRKQFLNLPANDFTLRPNAAMQVVTATKKGANAPRASFLTFDEVDLTPPEILSEAAFIADPAIRILPDGGHEKRNAIFVYLSSRKTNDGPIQDLITEATTPPKKNAIRKRIRLHKWSTVDWMQKCPDEVHKPENGQTKAYINTETLETHWDEESYSVVPESNQTKFKEYMAYEGCKTCPAWAACLGRSPNQRGRGFMLRDHEFVGDLLDSVKDPAAIIAQALNWKPETTGIVFKSFSHNKHVKEPIDFYEWVTNGIPFDPFKLGPDELKRRYEEGTAKELAEITPTKEDIYEAMTQSGWLVGGGIDWGYDPDPAVVVITGYHKKWRRSAVLHIEASTGFANHVWADYVAENVHTRFPMQFAAPDQADPSSITYFAKHKIKSLGRKDKPARIVTGVSFIRGLLWDPQKNQSNFAILDDSQTENSNDMMIQAMLHWTHAKDPLGRYVMDKFADDQWTHSLDALRYFLHPFTKNANITASAVQFAKTETTRDLIDGAARNDPEAIAMIKEKENMMNQMKEHMLAEHGLSNIFGTTSTPNPEEKDSKKSASTSGIKFSIGGD